MSNNKIESIKALEILDSRGFPTVKVQVTLKGGVTASASVPSGASTGENEAVELRDGDTRRYNGKGVLRAVANVNDVIAPKLVGKDPGRQTDIDHMMIELDGTPNKAKLGANAILGVSMAVARAAANGLGIPLYTYLGGPTATELPVPMFNVINGGKHADNNLDLQEFMIVPMGAPSFAEALRYASETFQALKTALKSRDLSTNVGDEGGFAPKLKGHSDALDLIVQSIEKAGYRPGEDIGIALDPAANSFYAVDGYDLKKSKEGRKSREQLLELYSEWIAKYPIISIEDGFDEKDWEGFRAMTKALGDKIQIVGDDLYVTNTKFIQRGIDEQASNAALIKLNQIGTVTETVDAVKLCRRAGFGIVTSHRSGETSDTFLADFTVAMGTGQIKSGSVCRGERVAKYNRFLEIEAELGDMAKYPGAAIYRSNACK